MTHKFREDGSHYNGGKVFFGYGYRAVDEPRLKMVRRWYRQGEMRGKSEDWFFVDGARVETYEAALEALKVPVSFTADEIAALKIIGDEPADLRKILNFEVRYSLGEKGAIAWGPPGECRRTDVGRTAIRAACAHDYEAPEHPMTLIERLREWADGFRHDELQLKGDLADKLQAFRMQRAALLDEAAGALIASAERERALREALGTMIRVVDEFYEFHDSRKKPCGEYGMECPIGMGEWVDKEDRMRLEAARVVFSSTEVGK